MKTVVLLIVLCLTITVGVIGQGRKLPDTYRLPKHPRLILLENETASVKSSVANWPVWKKMHEVILSECEKIIGLPPLERILIGRRLLDVSRECIRRIFYLSYAYRMTGEEKYFHRAEKEMLSVARFSDWNPDHLIGVAELTFGMAIGYDWLNDKFPKATKQLISDAILKKGLEPSFDSRYNAFVSLETTWNQACNGGLTYGALAIADEHPEIARQIIDRALITISLPMEGYKPDGAVPEGYGYWGYGTSFTVLFLSAMEKNFLTDFGLSQMPGFLKTPLYRENMIGPTGVCFNWGDAGPAMGLSSSMFWFANKNNDPSLLWMNKRLIEKNDYEPFTRERLLPLVVIWGKDIPWDKITEPVTKVYVGQGASPVALMRTSWSNPNAIYLGFKVGSSSVNHAHMDIGSFVMESDGIRWASDFGMQDYESLESKGIQLWDRTQDAQRWTVFRLNNFAHSTLAVDGQLQLVNGYAKVDRYSDHADFAFAISDLSAIYEGQLKKVSRGVAIVDEQYVVIEDELTTLNKPTKVRWTMMTTAQVSLAGNSAVLTKDGKQLTLRIEGPSNITLKTWTTDPSTNYDTPNPGTTLVGFEIELPANKEATFVAKLIPKNAGKNSKVKPNR